MRVKIQVSTMSHFDMHFVHDVAVADFDIVLRTFEKYCRAEKQCQRA
jgi:hypothetical protein